MRPKIVIAAPLRTAIGKGAAREGVFRDVKAQELLKECFAQVIERSGVNPALINDIIAGTCMHLYDAPDVARVAALLAGLPAHIPAYSVQRNCASGLQAITSAATHIRAGEGDIYLAGGTESMSNFPYVIERARWGLELRDGVIHDSLWRGLTDPILNMHMGETVEHVARKYETTRRMQDVFAVASHRKAVKAQDSGKFESQIIPVRVRERGGVGVATQDQCIRREISAPFLATLKPAFTKKEDGGTVTPGNACPFADGAAAMLVLTASQAKKLHTEPMAEIIDYVYVGLDPLYMGEGPIFAIRKLLSRVGISIEEVDFFEINEAFAAQCLPCQTELEIPDEKLNVWGGAIALGHPVGATGAIMTVKAAHILKEYDAEYAVISMCVGGGMAGAMLIRNYPGTRGRQ